MDVAGEDDGECGLGFASPDEADGGFALELDDDWLREFLFLPQGLWLGGGCPGWAQGCGLDLGCEVKPASNASYTSLRCLMVAGGVEGVLMSNLIPASGFGAGSARAAGSGLVSSVTGSGGRPRGLARAVQRELEWTAGRGDVVRAVDAARAELTNQAMGNVGNLVMTGQALVQVAPESAPYLEALLGAYATGAAQAIARFQ